MSYRRRPKSYRKVAPHAAPRRAPVFTPKASREVAPLVEELPRPERVQLQTAEQRRNAILESVRVGDSARKIALFSAGINSYSKDAVERWLHDIVELAGLVRGALASGVSPNGVVGFAPNGKGGDE